MTEDMACQDITKASKLLHRAGGLGYTKSYTNAGIIYYRGEGVERDFKKAFHCFELAAIGGDGQAKCIIGDRDERYGNRGSFSIL